MNETEILSIALRAKEIRKVLPVLREHCDTLEGNLTALALRWAALHDVECGSDEADILMSVILDGADYAEAKSLVELSRGAEQ